MQITRKLAPLLAAAALGAAGLRARAQDQNNPPPPPPPPDTAGPAGIGEYTGPYPSSWLEAEADAEYAFRFKATGLNAELGAGVAPGQFIGFQFEYFNPWVGPGNATFDSLPTPYPARETIETYEAAYRFTIRLPQSPLSIYGGVSGGVGNVELRQNGPVFTVYNRDRDRLAAGGVAGLQWALARYASVKVGYRYIFLDNVHLAGHHADIETGALEAGLNFRF